eukprot:361018_1
MGTNMSKMDCFSLDPSEFADNYETQSSRSHSASKTPQSPSTSASTDHKSKINRTCIKVLFLDVDGVLNHQFTEWNENTRGIEDHLVKYLKMILDKTRCKIVLSTTWRLYPQYKCILLDVLQTRGDVNVMDVVIGQTPDIPHCKRPTEILRFIEQYNANDLNKYQICSYCIIDDLPLFKYPDSSFLDGHFVQTDKKTGISLFNVIECIQILLQDYNEYS